VSVSAKILAQRAVGLFVLLSPQLRYSWGLHELKPILTLAGRLLQEIKSSRQEPITDVKEAALLLKAVRMNTLSKLPCTDSRRFQDSCLDRFPGVNVKDIEHKELEAVIRDTCKEPVDRPPGAVGQSRPV